MRILDRATVAELLDLDQLVDALAVAMTDLSAGRATVPPRTGAAIAAAGVLVAMPAYCPSLGLAAAKLLTVYPGNAAAGRPVHQAVVVAVDPETGSPVALLDGDAITELRTAAGSALSVRLLARPDARTLAVVGTGPQALAHARVVVRERPFDRVLVGGRNRERAERVVADLAAHGVDATACTIAEAVGEGDVVCGTTSAVEPLVRAGEVRDGVHVAAVGYARGGGEVDPALMASALLVVEHRDTVLTAWPAGADDVIDAVARGLVALDDVVEIGELVAGTRAGRTDDRQRTVYRSVGLAVQDVAAAAVVLRAAGTRGLGTVVEL
ncbi:ornithine cyclodeaminase family protein [Pseudonocardia benzenivorans]|uniref:Ornithine cyclodeaminase family protein n=1 Tax=Pseudonocardia benzenivorans TaxID=228005 RepID=A0ABW3VIS2_9PSEU|nr:alanine dehydrogenase [Pseudonocardia sp. D17]